MKKLLSAVLFSCILLPLMAQQEFAEPNYPVKASLQNSGSFSMIMLGDPQAYTFYESNQPLFEHQLAWIVANKEKLNILTTLITGDYIEQNNKIQNMTDKYAFQNGDQTSAQQWASVSRALERLDNRVPYIGCQGNHDVGYVAAENHYSEMSTCFYPSRNRLNEEHLVAMGTNVRGERTMENAAYEFKTDTWGDLLIIALEFAPRDEALDWARELINSDKYKNHRVFILIHSFLNENNTIVTSESYPLQPRNWGMDVWNKLIKDSKNIVAVFCGHTGVPPTIGNTPAETDYSCTVAYRTDKATDGRMIPSMMFNVQMADGDWRGDGGDGWLRILEFKPDGQTISVRTFSPLFAMSKLTKNFAWRTASYDQFNITVPKLK